MNPDTPRLLLVDDEDSIREPLLSYLSDQHFTVCGVSDAAAARALIADQSFDLILLDIMMPGEDGLSLCRFLAEKNIPVILLTAKSEAIDKIVGLEIGADDYVVKPFDPRELVARVRSVLRRSSDSRSGGTLADDNQGSVTNQPKMPTFAGYEFEGWFLDTLKLCLSDPDGVLIPISTAEFKLLEALAKRAGQVMSRDELLLKVQGRETQAFDRAIDNQISRLRKKIEADPSNPKLLQTVWGGGYRLSAVVTERSSSE